MIVQPLIIMPRRARRIRNVGEGAIIPTFTGGETSNCFLCNKVSSEKEITLLVAETTCSRINLADKLQEILGGKFYAVISSKDSVCWACAEEINRCDQYEFEIDEFKERLVNKLMVKHKHEDFSKFALLQCDNVVPPRESNGNTSSYFSSDEDDSGANQRDLCDETGMMLNQNMQNGRNYLEPRKDGKNFKTEKSRKEVRFNPVVKFKVTHGNRDSSGQSHSIRTSEADEGEIQCPTCLHFFPKNEIFENHIKLHNLAKSRGFKCKLCDFSTTSLDSYCRHMCNSNSGLYLSCMECRKNYYRGPGETEKSMCPSCVRDSNNIIHQLETGESNSLTLGFERGSNKSNLVRKLTAEGSIEYEEAPQDSLNSEDSSITRGGEEKNSETDAISEEGDMEYDNVLYMYNDKIDDTNPDGKINSNEVKEVVVPDHVLEQISKETSINLPCMLKCSNCQEVLDVRHIPAHRCFIEKQTVEFSEVESALEIDMGLSKKILNNSGEGNYGYVSQDGYYEDAQIVGVIEENDIENDGPRLLCKTCLEQFPSIVQLREHWQETGHAWEVGTLNVDVKTIKEKVKDNEQTFRVVKQTFSMKANMPLQSNIHESEFTDEHIFNIKNMFVKVKSDNECETCGKLFPNEELLRDHIVDDCLNCIHCGIRFLSNNLLKKHYQCTGHWRKIPRIQRELEKLSQKETSGSVGEESEDLENENENDDNTLVCPICDQDFNSKRTFGVHLQSHYRNSSVVACYICLKEFNKSDLVDHVVQTHNAFLFKCKYCDKIFFSETNRDKHQFIKHKNVPVHCNVCNVKFSSITFLLKHIKFHGERNCKFCGAVNFKSWQSLRRHIRCHMYEEGLKCSLCNICFKNKFELKIHNATHSEEEFAYQCEFCNRGFNCLQSLAVHKAFHLKSIKVCSKCGKRCNSNTSFWEHHRNHYGPFICNVCGRVFRDTGLLAVHRKKHPRVRCYQCPYCPSLFSVPSTLDRHMKMHKNIYSSRCSLCRRCFPSVNLFHSHLYQFHKVKYTRVCSRQTLPINPTDEDIFHAADSLISEDSVMLNGYQRDESSELVTEIVIETSELFDEILE